MNLNKVEKNQFFIFILIDLKSNVIELSAIKRSINQIFVKT
jgi:hypothetical protein